MVGDIGDGDSLAGHAFHGFSEVFAVGQHLHTKLHAAAHDGLRRKLRRQVDGDEARRRRGKEHLHGFNRGIIQNGHLIAFDEAHVVEQGTFAGHKVARLLVGQ